MGEDLDWVTDELPLFSGEEQSLLAEACERHDVPSKLVAKLLDIEREHYGMSRRAAIHKRISAAFGEDWRSEEEVLAQHEKTAV